MLVHPLVTFLSFHVRQTVALPREAVTGKVLRVGSERVAVALHTHVVDGISEESWHAVLTVPAFCVVDALQALAGLRVAVPGLLWVPVPATVAGDAGASRDLWVAVEIVRADIAAGSLK